MAETNARIVIDRKLIEAGWDIENKMQVDTEVNANGKADYLLRDKSGKPLAVIEAKDDHIDPYTAKNQAKRYIDDLGVKFAFLANSETVYFWDIEKADARVVSGFFSQGDLERLNVKYQYQKALSDIPFDIDIANRDYQQDAQKAIDREILKGNRKILIEMATGTGKTRTITSEIQRLLKSGFVNKVLVLVDREELAKQAYGTFQEHLKEYGSYIYHYAKPREGNTITVSTLQTLQNHYDKFSPGYFDLVVVDECHRSIYGSWRAILDHFDAIKIGLTATPSNLVDRSTFGFFNTNEPHYSYGMRKAIKEKFLADYTVYSARTDITLNGVVDKDTGETYLPKDLERKITVPERNMEIVKDFKEKVKMNSKSLWFAVSQKHAVTLTSMLNEAFPEYNGKYAELIDYTVESKDEIIKKYKKEELPYAIVSVDMLTTGFDAPKIENLVFVRPTKSPILYQQMRGRGTRLYYKDGELVKDKFVMFDYVGVYDYFKELGYEDKNKEAPKGGEIKLEYNEQNINDEATQEGLRDFKEIHADDQIVSSEMIEVGNGEKIDIRDYQGKFENLILTKSEEIEILKKIKNGEIENVSEQDIDSLEKDFTEKYNIYRTENLRRAYKQPKANFFDFLQDIFGIKSFPKREEQIDELFDDWLSNYEVNEKQALLLKTLKNYIIANNKPITLNSSDDIQVFSKVTSNLGGIKNAISIFGAEELKEKVEDLNTICNI